jgi:hypothetical protein
VPQVGEHPENQSSAGILGNLGRDVGDYRARATDCLMR